ncbi:MAG: trypsin-like peptidase domain-containing protein [Burkholderiales bacterium]
MSVEVTILRGAAPARLARRALESALLAVAVLQAAPAPAEAPTPATPAVVSYRSAVASAAASVVTVHAAQASSGFLPLAPKVVAKGLASGVIVDRDGHVVTNYHVIEDASELAIARPDGTVYPARVIGTDPASDIALLKIDGDGLQPIAFADLDDVAVGDVVLAVGNPFGIGQTVTQGIVSAIVRRGTEPLDNFVQTDAAINPGNSGGALIDTAGRLIGVNTVILSKSGGSEGIGFAIPGDLVQTVVASLKAKGRVARSWIGMSMATASGGGARVVGVDRGGPAERAGIVPGDVVVRVDGRPVRHPQDVNYVAIGNEAGTRVTMEIARSGGKRESVDVRLAANPSGDRK